MNTFSELLSFLVHQKDIPVYPMTQYCEIERTLMYQYLNGKAIPDNHSVIERMADFMRLSPSERSRLITAWKIQMVGPDKWNSRCRIENFLRNFPDISQKSMPERTYYTETLIETSYPPCHPLPTHAALNHAVNRILLDEFRNEKGYLRMILQPDYDYLFQSLAGFGQYMTSCSIEHILCVGKSTPPADFTDGSGNLEYLQKILSLYINAMDYTVYYYYDTVESHFSGLNAFPCLILTSTCAITCTSDFQSGILYGNSDVITMLTRYFDQCRRKCSALFYPLSSVTETCRLITDMFSGDTPYFFLQAQPYIIPFLTSDLAEKAVSPDLKDRNLFLELISHLMTVHQENASEKKLHMYHTFHGIRRFLETGRIHEIPFNFSEPCSYDDRLLLIYRLSRYIPDQCRFLRGPLEKLSLNFHLCVSECGGYLIFSNRKGETIYLRFTEPGLLSAFTDYLENIDENYLYSCEESKEMIRKLLESQPESI